MFYFVSLINNSFQTFYSLFFIYQFTDQFLQICHRSFLQIKECRNCILIVVCSPLITPWHEKFTFIFYLVLICISARFSKLMFNQYLTVADAVTGVSLPCVSITHTYMKENTFKAIIDELIIQDQFAFLISLAVKHVIGCVSQHGAMVNELLTVISQTPSWSSHVELYEL